MIDLDGRVCLDYDDSPEYFLKEYQPYQDATLRQAIGERQSHIKNICSFGALPPRPKHLDVGCATGLMLGVAKQAGWEPTGVEVSKLAADYAAQTTGCPVFVGTLEGATLSSESMDVVTMNDVIEHVPDPLGLMREVYRVLRPGGVAYLVTPNLGSLCMRLFKEEAYGVWPDRHLVYFERSSMKHLLNKVGFRRIRIKSKDIYASNFRRLTRLQSTARDEGLKHAFGENSLLSSLRNIGNVLFAHVLLGDKLVTCAQK